MPLTLHLKPAEEGGFTARIRPRKFTIAEYYRMAEAGILTPKERVELLNGQIIRMAPIGDRHQSVVDTLNGIFGDQRKGRYLLRVNGPIRIPNFNEPQPDLTLYKRGVQKHPTPEDIYLVIEVSDTSVGHEVGPKKTVYERAGVQEYWVIDIKQKVVLIHQLEGNLYQVAMHRQGVIAPQAFPDVAVGLDELFERPG